MTIHRKRMCESFRKFMEDHDLECKYSDGEEIEDTHIMCLYGYLMKTWHLATEEKEREEASKSTSG